MRAVASGSTLVGSLSAMCNLRRRFTKRSRTRATLPQTKVVGSARGGLVARRAFEIAPAPSGRLDPSGPVVHVAGDSSRDEIRVVGQRGGLARLSLPRPPRRADREP